MSSSAQVEEGFDAPIDNFVFRQCPAEFKLKATAENSKANWTTNLPPKNSLIQISHAKGIIMFPHYEKGALAYAPIENLAEKDSLTHEFLTFPGDESFILSLCLDPSERFLYVTKGSNKIYAVDLAKDSINKLPFVSKITQLESAAVECVTSQKFGLLVLLENGKIVSFLNEPVLQESEIDFSFLKKSISCISQPQNDLIVLGCKEESELFLINLNDPEKSLQTISVPFDELNSGSKGISSIFLFPNGNSLLFSCKADEPESDDVPLLLLENLNDCDNLKFSFFFDPCASRPPRQNQFYFLSVPFSKWSNFFVIGNSASPDLGICGQLTETDEFTTFFIDNDEGLAQLPFVDGEVTYPMGLALDLSSKTKLDNLTDPDAEKYPPAPIVWVLTNSAQLCPFYLVKTDETEEFSFMRTVPSVNFPKETVSASETASTNSSFAAPIVTSSAPQTPSKVPLQQLASLQKSTEIKPIDKIDIPVTPVKQVTQVVEKTSSKNATNADSVPSIITIEAEPEPVLQPKTEKMETITVGPYQNILLSEIAATHAAMQEDLFALKQLSLKNSLILRKNSQKYFNSLESLETYAISLEKLLSSSDKVFLNVKDRLDDLKVNLKELLGKTKQIKNTWNRIKQDNKINWDARVRTLTVVSQDLFERIDRIKSFMSNPNDVTKYRATLESFVDSAQEKIQILMAHLSGLFVCESEEISTLYADLGSLSLSPSLSGGEGLLDQLNVLSLESNGSQEAFDPLLKIKKRNKSLLNAVKSRGARLLIPNKISPTVVASQAQQLKLTPEDESLISSFISAIKLTEDVPEFIETQNIEKLTLNDAETKEVKVETKPAEIKPFSFNVTKSEIVETKPTESKLAETKPFSFGVSESKPAETKPSEIKPFSFNVTETKPIETKPLETKSIESKPAESKPFSFGTSETKSFSFGTSESKPTESKPAESKPFSFGISESKPTFSFGSTETKLAFNFDSSSDTKLNEPSVFKVDPKATETNTEKPVESFEFKSLDKSETLTKSEIPKIPSIFTLSSQPAVTEHESVLKKESPLPTFDSLNFEKEPEKKIDSIPASTDEDVKVKPFPSIFGVKTAEVKEEKKEESSPIATSPASQGFSFNFKPTEKEPNASLTTPSANPASTATATPAAPLSFSFAPAETPVGAPSTGFSITTKPTFDSSTSAPTFSFGFASQPTSSPVFGAPSMPKTPSFGQTSFGSSSLTAAPQPASGGFAAFAAASNSQNSTSFSSFASVAPSNSGGLTFASFIPASNDSQNEKKNQQQSQGNQQPASSTFSFTGFRE